MPRNKDGSVILPHNFKIEDQQNLVFNGTRLHENFNDLAEIATTSLDTNGTNKMKADLDMGGKKLKNVALGTKDDDIALLSQVGSGGIIAMDEVGIEDNGQTLVLRPKANIRCTKVTEGMVFCFKAVTDFKNYKNVKLHFSNEDTTPYISPLKNVGAGSWVKQELMFLMFLANFLLPVNPDKTAIPLSIGNDSFTDFDEVLNSCQLWVVVRDGHADKAPDRDWGLLTVKSSSGANIGQQGYVSQTYHTLTNHLYIRMKVDDKPWQKWERCLTAEEISLFQVKD